MKDILLDTNILVRFITGEPAEQAAQARETILSAEAGNFRLLVLPMVLAECVYVLTKFYGFPRQSVATALTGLLSAPVFQSGESQRMAAALGFFGKGKLDFVDCYLAAASINEGLPLATFDQDIRKLSGVKWMRPGMLKD